MPDTEESQGQQYVAGGSILSGNHKVSDVLLTGPQVSEWLGIPPGTWRNWTSKGLAPKADEYFAKNIPLWSLGTVGEYLRNAPGGRLGYPVG